MHLRTMLIFLMEIYLIEFDSNISKMSALIIEYKSICVNQCCD